MYSKDAFCVSCFTFFGILTPKEFVWSKKVMLSTENRRMLLCYICHKVATNAENFIKNVQKNQDFLQNIDLINESTYEQLLSQSEVKPNLTIYNKDLPEIYIYNEDDDVNTIDSFINDNEIECDVKLEPKVEISVDDDVFVMSDAIFDTYAEIQEDKGNVDKEIPIEYNDSTNNKTLDRKQKVKEKTKKNATHKKKSPHNEKSKDEKKSKKNANRPKKEKVKSEFEINDVEKYKIIDYAKYNNDECDSFIETFRITWEESKAEMLKLAQNNIGFQCNDCYKVFKFKNILEKHMKKHSEKQGEFVCDLCKQRFVSQEKLYDHKTYHFRRYRCKICGIIRLNIGNLRDHWRLKHAVDPAFPCPECGKTFIKKRTLHKHIKYSHGDRLRVSCEICFKTYANKDVLKAHLSTKHNSHDMKMKMTPHPCPVCNKEFSAPSRLKTHLTTHSDSREFYCVECDKSFKSRNILEQHFRTTSRHVTEKHLIFACDLCDKRFSVKRTLQRHRNNQHFNIKPFQCDQCEKAYRSGSALTAHIKIKHEGLKPPRTLPCPMCAKTFNRSHVLKSHILTHTGERPFQCNECPANFACDLCDKRFSVKRTLQRHRNNQHFNIKPFQCDQCEKAYRSGSALTAHIKIKHEGLKPPRTLPCPMCAKTFNRSHVLKSHILTHTGERPFQCNECPAKFTQRSVLRTHLRCVHLRLTRDGRSKPNR